MKNFNFGRASVSSAERIRNVAQMLQQFRNEKLLVVVSAVGKTTNALENVVNTFYKENQENALHLFDTIKKQHSEMAGALLENRKQNQPGSFFLGKLTDFLRKWNGCARQARL